MASLRWTEETQTLFGLFVTLSAKGNLQSSNYQKIQIMVFQVKETYKKLKTYSNSAEDLDDGNRKFIFAY